MLLAVTVLSGCTSSPPRQALQVALDLEASTAARQAAAARVSPEQTFDLFRLVSESRHPLSVRAAAVDRMLSVDSDRFWAMSAQRVAQIDDWPMIRLLCDQAAGAADPAALPWLIQSWSVPSTTVEEHGRPERQAITAIAGVDGFAYLRGLFVAPPAWVQPHIRAAIWTTLLRIDSIRPDRLLASAQSAYQARPGETDPLLDALSLCARVVQVYPYGPEGMLRMQTLVEQSTQAQWDDWEQWQSQRLDDPPATLALRHLPALTHRDPTLDGRSLAWWRAHIADRLQGRDHVYRGELAGDSVVTARSERLIDHQDRMGAADYVLLDLLLNVLEDRALVAEMFRQADADRLDTSTEFGGVLIWDTQGRVIAQGFPPVLRQHDQVFYASSACVNAMHTGLAHYHFHAQQHEHPTWAGPGGGDLRFADHLQANCVVFTFINANTLNVDVYFPGLVIVDLGCISR